MNATPRTRMVMIGQGVELPDDFSGRMVTVKIPLPDEAQRLAEIQKWIPILRSEDGKVSVPTASDHAVWSRLMTTSSTLTLRQISNILREVALRKKCVGEATAIAFHQQKVDNLLSTKIRIAPPPDAALGSFADFREWLDQESDYFNLNNPDVPAPKGCVLFGLPGTGKSLAAKIAGQVLGVPVLEVTPDLFLGGLVGESERKTRDLLEKLSAAAPAVVWFDEIEKLFGGMSNSDSNDGGVGTRVFGQVLNFLQENKTSLFFIATANRIQGLPPELVRVGRFDKIFWADLPSQDDRAEILAIHIKRWSKQMDAETITRLSDSIALITDGFAGSELAAIVQGAAREAYSGGHAGILELEHLQKRKNAIVPQSVTEADRFEAIRKQASGFCPASAQSRKKGSVGVSLGRMGVPSWTDEA